MRCICRFLVTTSAAAATDDVIITGVAAVWYDTARKTRRVLARTELI